MNGERHTILAKIALTIIVAACLVSAGYSSGTDMPGDHGSVAEPLAGTVWSLAAFRADSGSVIAPLPGAEPLIIFGESGHGLGVGGVQPLFGLIPDQRNHHHGGGGHGYRSAPCDGTLPSGESVPGTSRCGRIIPGGRRAVDPLRAFRAGSPHFFTSR